MSKTSNFVNNTPTSAKAPVNRFYRTVWRWHFYAGLFVIPFMLMLATTGIIYLFKPQLDALMYHNQMFVQPTNTILPYTQQLEAARSTYPDAKIAKLTPNLAPNRSAEVELTTSDERTLTVFVNPYTAQVLGDRDEVNNLQAYARKLHGELMIGRVGDYLIELAACWGLVLLLSGLYLWLPRHGFTVWGTLVPRWWSQNRRVFWRDLHAVAGLYGTLLVGFLILTGLPWTGFWGGTFAQISNQFPVQISNQVPKSRVLTRSLNQNGSQVVPWAVEQLPMPQSNPSKHQQHQGQGGASSSVARAGIPAGTPVNLDSVIALAQFKGAPAGFSVSLPADKTGVYTVSAYPDDPAQEMTLHIDQYSGKVLAEVHWQDYGLMAKAVELGIAVHMGKYFGLGNQLLMLLACLVVILLCVSGLVMWWQRRPASGIGAPTLPEHIPQWRTPMAIIAVLGAVFPLVGISLVTVLLLDYLLFSRVPLLKRVFN